MMIAVIASDSVSLDGVSAFTDLLNRIAEGFPTRHALAEALDINASRLSRALNGSEKFSFNVENCLRLAQISGEPASEVLRAADKGEIADLIESLYGSERTVTDAAVQALLEQWPTFTAEEKHYLRSNVRMVLRARRAGSDQRPIPVDGVPEVDTTTERPHDFVTKRDGQALAPVGSTAQDHSVPVASDSADGDAHAVLDRLLAPKRKAQLARAARKRAAATRRKAAGRRPAVPRPRS